MSNQNITSATSRVSIRKPEHGASCEFNNFGKNWTSAETLATTWRDIYVDDKLVGCAEKQDGTWWIDLDGAPTFELVGGFRSAAKALAQVEAAVATHMPVAAETKTEIAIGDSVRSFDFESRDLTGERACYVDGVVEAIGNPPRDVAFAGCDVYTIRVTHSVFGGATKTDRNGTIICPPVNGIDKLFGGKTDGVERL